MKRGSLGWILDNDVRRILGCLYDYDLMFSHLSNRFNALHEFGRPTPAIRVSLVNLALEISEAHAKTAKEINP